MTDQAQGVAAPGTTPAATGEAPRLTILTQYVKDLSFENPTAPVIFAQLKGQRRSR